ncbi:Killer toxin subunits alpha/beta [Madurella mycetomatis]|uniref:chitinase n=1 Tax=Madurella mycetomatis TaxID=100816 RepID=A0A175W6R6_9PEZI|nr:Killer toxin subunits alpha/beta [Madurella mycetomatis]
MVTLSWLTAIGLLLSGAVAKKPASRFASGPPYRVVEVCPERCSISGPKTGNWSVYPNFKQISSCEQTMFYDFSLYDPVDDPTTNHRIHACSSFGPDFSEMPDSPTRVASAAPVDVRFEVGWWDEGFGLAAPGLRSLIRQIRKYIDKGYGETDTPFVMFGQSGQATIGLYIGQSLLNQAISESALRILYDNLANLNASTPSLAMQLCGPGYDSVHTFGVMVASNAKFAAIQDAILTWSNATCLSLAGFISFPGRVKFITPLLPTNGTTQSNSTIHTRALYARAVCRTVQVESGDSCASLATKCGISGPDFTKYNPGSSLCSTLKPKQHVCCSSGDLPDFRPKPNADGSCHSYQVKRGDNCASLAAEYSLTLEEIEDFNKNSWGWGGCKLLFFDTVMCLSTGTPPFPAPISNAVCGPQKPGSRPPTDGSKIAELNPCPLNACCNIWGQCGITDDFCIDTNTGPPGTAATGTYGCISNCGLDVVKGDGTGAIKIGYFEGFGFSRECLFQDASQIDTSGYTHIHFAFGTLTDSFEVEVGDALSSYQFSEFKRLPGVKRILSLGGWTFSNDPDTYHIFRNGVTPANRLRMATNIANFIKENNLDGVDIDWEYPGAPDIPGIPAGNTDEGPNYLALLVILKNLLPGKSVSIAAPSSYWYLKQYPIKDIGRVVDYIVYMTYDLHGQWDAHNRGSQEGCSTGTCLRSQVNLTETRQSLAMITKAGVPGAKVIVGVTSYGRSFEMAQPGCWGPNCLFTGDRMTSNAKKGVCTGVSGYLANAEIYEIMQNSARVVRSFVDPTSNSDILVYDNNQWVSYMSSAIKNVRTTLYRAWGMGGTSDWATDLQKYHPVPRPAKDWATYKRLASTGQDPKADNTRTGGWTEFDCMHDTILNAQVYTPSERWRAVKADDAWRDVVRIWKDTDSHRLQANFMTSVTDTLDMGGGTHCERIDGCSCDTRRDCPNSANGPFSGAAAQFIYNSLVTIHLMHHDYIDALLGVAAIAGTALDDLQNKFAPTPPPEDNNWRLLLIDLITLGTLSTAAPYFNALLKTKPYFTQNNMNIENAKDATMTLIGQTTTIAKDLLPSDDDLPWLPEERAAFSNYMGQSIDGWRKAAQRALNKLFDGSDESLEILWDVMSDGKLIDGRFVTTPALSDNKKKRDDDLRDNVAKSFFGYAIPTLWRLSETYAFVLDTGLGCTDDKNPLREYLDDDAMAATGDCVNGKQYYLVHPAGESNGECRCHSYSAPGVCIDLRCEDHKKFSVPPGLNSLNGRTFGAVTEQNLIKGSVRTWLQNGKKNGAGFADPHNSATIDNLLNTDITTPGFIRLPVCSPERALQSWETTHKGSSANYPCDIPPGRSYCGDSTFVDQTSAASPKVEDCLQIIRNIEGDGSTEWTHQVLGKGHRTIASAGGCRFGVEATHENGNANFKVGGQDVIDIINDAVRKFGGSGRVGAKGEMTCDGNINSVPILWGIF